MNKTNSTFEAMLKAAISRDSTGGATDTMLIHAQSSTDEDVWYSSGC